MNLVDFHPIYDRQKVRFITTYICSKAYSTKETFWFVLYKNKMILKNLVFKSRFGNQPCHDINLSMIIYEWYYNIPPVRWPKGYFNLIYYYLNIHLNYNRCWFSSWKRYTISIYCCSYSIFN